MGGVRPPILAGAGERYSLLVAGKLNELAELFLSEHLQGDPEQLDVLVGLHQTHLVHGVSLRGREQGILCINTNLEAFLMQIRCISDGPQQFGNICLHRFQQALSSMQTLRNSRLM